MKETQIHTKWHYRVKTVGTMEDVDERKVNGQGNENEMWNGLSSNAKKWFW